MECDAVTFASGVNAGLHKDALWTRQPGESGPQLAAFELPGGTCGFHKGSLANGTLVLAPGACLLKDANGVFVRDVTGKPIQNLADVGDDDGDALLNCWENCSDLPVNEPCPGCTKEGSRDRLRREASGT